MHLNHRIRKNIGTVLLLLPIMAFAAEDTQANMPPLPAPNVQETADSGQLTSAQQAEVEQLMQQIQMLGQQAQTAQSAATAPSNQQNQAAANNTNQNAAQNQQNGASQFFNNPQTTFGTVFDPAFQNIIKRQFPLTPQQIKALREVFQTIQRAKAAPIEVPTPTVSTRNVLLAPGSVPPVIKMAQGYVSSIVFLDDTGQPWPIANFSVGNPNAFDIQWDTTSNVLMIQGVAAYESSNMAVRLQGLETPVMVTMVNDQQKVDYRVDLRVQGRGPNAKAPIIGSILPGKANNILLDLLDGVPPSGSEKITIKGGAAEGWTYNHKLYIRSRLTLLSPSWSGTMSSADGTNVYELNQTPLLLGSHQGQTVELKVEGL